MKEKIEERLNDRGQVGIGTLIVFIAMVLVAAIAAGVLINTAGFLQTKSEQTGQESADQVSNRVVVVSKVGNVGDLSGLSDEEADINDDDDPEENGVNTMTMTVMKSAGSGDIDLGAATLSWNGPDETSTLTYVSPNEFDSGEYSNGDPVDPSQVFTVRDVRNDGDSDAPVLTGQEDRYEIEFDASAVDTDELAESENAQIQLTSRSGATTLIRVNIPDSLAGDNTVEV